MSKQVLEITLKKIGDKLIPRSKLDAEKYKLFIRGLKNEDIVKMLLESEAEDRTLGQLAKVHICIQELAKEQGCSAAEMKKIIKRECGMSKKDATGKEIFESFGKCSKERLSDVIDVIVTTGQFLNINFEGLR